MVGIILAAGYGTRLHPITDKRPKGLLRVNNQRILDYVYFQLSKINLDKIYMVSNNKYYNQLASWCEVRNIKIINNGTNSSDQSLGALNDLMLVIEREAIEDDLFIIGSDAICEFDLSFMTDKFNKVQNHIIAAVDCHDISLMSGLGEVEINSSGKVVNFTEKPDNPQSTISSTVYYALHKRAISHLSDYLGDYDNQEVGNLIEYLLSVDEVEAILYDEPWIDVGTMESYYLAKEKFRRR